MYIVTHIYDVDGEFGDAIPQSEFVCAFKTKKEAEEYAKKYSRPRIYARPYAELECGTLIVEEIKNGDINVPPEKISPTLKDYFSMKEGETDD